jgi:hypothetical protein
VSNDFLSGYKKKVVTTLGTSEPQEDLNISTSSKDLNAYKEKIKFAGLTADQSMNDNLAQYRSLQSALHHSYNTEKLRFIEDPTGESDGIEYLGLIEKAKEDFSEDDEYIGMDFNETPIAVGRTIDWIRTGFKYLVMEQDLSTRAYFSGKIRRANYLIKWTDPDANIYQQWVAIEGPSQPDADFKKSAATSSIIDTGGNQISMYIGKSDATHFLKRYNRIIIKDSDEIDTTNQKKVLVRAWRLDVIDDISNKFITKISLKENYISQSELTDSEVYALTFNNADHLYEFQVPLTPTMATGYVLYKDNISLYKNGSLLELDPSVFNVYVNGFLVEDLQPFNVAGDYFIKITADGYPASYGETISFGSAGATVVYEIRGSDRIKPYETYSYEVKKIVDGLHTGTTGTWSFSNPKVIQGYTASGDSVSFIAKDRLGDFDLTFTDSNGSYTKTLTIISMLLKQ